MSFSTKQNVSKKVFKKRSIYAAIAAAVSVPAFGQDAPNAGALQRELELQLERSQPSLPVQPRTPAKPRESKPDEQTLDVKGFKFTGNTLHSSFELEEVVKPWVGKTIPFSALNDVTTAVQEFYFSKNRLVQVTVPPQEVMDGIIELSVVEGKMGEVSVKQGKPEQPVRFSDEKVKLYVSAGNDGGQYIDTKALERATMILNEVPGVRATVSFEPGEEPGTSDLVAQIEATPFFSGQVAVTNYGSPSTGAAQAVANLSLNNISGIGDQINLDVIQSLGSSYGQMAYNIPIGSGGWKAGVQGSYLSYQSLSSWSPTPTAGSANTLNANLSYALERSQAANSTLKFTLENRSYINTQQGNTISEYQITAATVGVNGNWASRPGVILNYGATLTLGRLGISNMTQAGQDETGPGTAGSYGKLAFNISQYRELNILPNTSWTNSIYGQLANKNLNSSEQIYMGGPYGVRAYPVAQGGGSQGAIFTSELNHRLNENWNIGAFVDIGVVQQYVRPYPNWQGLTSAANIYQLADVGLTAKYTYNNLIISAALAFRVGQNPLYNSKGEQLNADNAYRPVQGWLRVSYMF